MSSSSNNAECEIYEVPVEDEGENDQEEEVTIPVSDRKVAKKRALRHPVTGAAREKLLKNLEKARATQKLMRENKKLAREEVDRNYKQKLKIHEELVEERPELEDRLVARSKGRGPRPKTKYIIDPTPKRAHRRKVYESEEEYDTEESEEDGWSSDEENSKRSNAGRPRGPNYKPRAKRPPKVKKISEKEARLMLLEKKLDEIISHTKKSSEKPRTVKSTTTIYQAPKTSGDNSQLKKAAAQLLNLF